jgi:hypothetical protein
MDFDTFKRLSKTDNSNDPLTEEHPALGSRSSAGKQSLMFG